MPTISNLQCNSLGTNSASGSFNWSADCASVQARTDQTGDSLTFTPFAGGSGSWTNTGLASNRTVRLDGWGFDSLGNKGAETTIFYTTLSTSPPPQVSSVTASPVLTTSHTPKRMNVSWSAASTATGYRVYWSDDGGSNFFPVTGTDGQVGNTTSYTFTNTYEWQYYKFQVTATNAYGNAPNAYSGLVKSNDSYPPVMTNFYVNGATTSSTISVYASAVDVTPDFGTASGVNTSTVATFYRNGIVAAATVSVDSSGQSFYTYTGLAANTSYNLQVVMRDAGGNTVTSNTISGTTLPATPVGTPSVTATPQTGKQTALSWTSVTGATKYEVWKAAGGGSDFWVADATGLSYTVPIDAEYIVYTYKIKPWNAAGYGTTGSTTARSRDETLPTFGSFYSTVATSNTITVVVTSTADPVPSTTPTSAASGIDHVDFYKNGVFYATQSSTGGDVYKTYTSLAAGTYALHANIYDLQGNMTQTSVINIPTSVRPNFWAWTNPKTSGGDFNITKTEWDNFTAHINSVRAYWDAAYNAGTDIGAYSFTTATTGANFQAFYYTQARTAINDMSPPTAVPSSRTTGDPILASDINALRDSINSIL